MSVLPPPITAHLADVANDYDIILSDVWGVTSPMETRTVDTHVMRLREKLGAGRDRVETVRGIGYRMLGA